MITQTTVMFKGTEAQFKAFTDRCEMSEYLFSKTLAQRVQGLPPAEAEEFIRGWFQSVRHMAIANWIDCGVETTVEHK